MSLYDPLINYCERTAPGLLAEPLNAISNAAFFLAAWLLWRQYKATHAHNRPALTLITLLTLVGTGSTLFHTFANRLTMLGDVIPIALFTFYYLWTALRRLLGCGRFCASAYLVLFAALAAIAEQVPDPYRFNGSISYFPCLFAVTVMACALLIKKHPAAKYLFQAAALFAVSLTFRSIDYVVCPTFSIGTHFLWHCLNGAMLYLLTRPIIRVD